MKKHGELRAAFPITVPVLAGYLFLGIAFGVLMSSKGYGPLWSLGVSLFVYAGSMQFVAAGMLAAGFDPLGTVLMTLMVNARHFFYGISMLDKFHGTGKYKPYLIFALSDETFSILSATEVPAGCDKGRFYFFIALLNQLYWVVGSALGGVFGRLIPFDTTGIDFVLTALFVVLFIGQWDQTHNHRPMLMGVGCAAACLVVFGADQFMIPAMLCILVCAGVFQKAWGGDGMNTGQSLLFFGIVALITVFTRAAAFLLFPEGRRTPRFVTYLGKVLPYTMIGLLVVYCLKGVDVLRYPYGLPELIGVAAVAGLHLWKKNTFLSIGAGTVLYMLLVQLVF